jgi:hypothetical protein
MIEVRSILEWRAWTDNVQPSSQVVGSLAVPALDLYSSVSSMFQREKSIPLWRSEVELNKLVCHLRAAKSITAEVQ